MLESRRDLASPFTNRDSNRERKAATGEGECSAGSTNSRKLIAFSSDLPRRGLTKQPRVASAASALWVACPKRNLNAESVPQKRHRTLNLVQPLQGRNTYALPYPRVRSLRSRPWAMLWNPFGVNHW